MNFTDVTCDVVDILPVDTKEDKYVRDALIQTDSRSFASRSSQVIKRKAVNTQTEDSTVKYSPHLVQSNDPSLARFLETVTPSVLEVLSENVNSTAFVGYDVDWSENVDEITCTLSLSDPSAIENELELSCITWSAQGSLVAASFSQRDHEDWCTHKSSVVLWNTDRTKLDPKKAQNALEISSCIPSLSFHPTNPAILAAGTFNGEVIIWDLSRDESNQMIVMLSSLHSEPITSLAWVDDPESTAASAPRLLVSAGLDGKVLLSSLNERNKTLTLTSGLVLLAESFSNKKSKFLPPDTTMGISSMSVGHFDTASFIAGSESGGVFRCSLSHSGGSRIVHSISQEDLEFSSAAQLSLSPHSSPVTCVSCSPFYRNAVLTSSYDASIRLFNSLQIDPCLTIRTSNPVLGLDWSNSRPMVFAAVTAAGQLLVYDLVLNKNAPTLTLQIGSKSREGTFVRFNPSRRGVLATGDTRGELKIWRLSSQLSEPVDTKEISELESLCEKSE